MFSLISIFIPERFAEILEGRCGFLHLLIQLPTILLLLSPKVQSAPRFRPRSRDLRVWFGESLSSLYFKALRGCSEGEREEYRVFAHR